MNIFVTSLYDKLAFNAINNIIGFNEFCRLISVQFFFFIN